MAVTCNLHIEKKRGYVWIRLPNVIKSENIIQIEKKIENSLKNCKSKVVLDFADTLNVFSTLVTLIMLIRKRVDEYGGELCLVNVSDTCKSKLKERNLDKIMII
jgi:anti-anti-sigma regulatory factor